MSQNYTAQSIQIMEGLQAVRKRPGMYIGSTDSRGLHHLVWEIMDNAIDEALNGYGQEITVVIEHGNVIRVEDHGRGMPVGKHASGKSALEVIFTVLHAGGKFSEAAGYKTSGGLHGVGASVVNALSRWCEVTVEDGTSRWQMRFSDGGSQCGPLEKIGSTRKTGSTVRFLADERIFSTLDYRYDLICERAQESAFLLDGVAFNVRDERKGEASRFQYEHGLRAFMDTLTEDRNVIGSPIEISGTVQEVGVRIMLALTDSYQEHVYSFVNMVRTADGGTHEAGLRAGLTKAVNDYARKTGLLKEKDKNYEGSDIREGLTGILVVSVPEHLLQFEGQTKGKLGSAQVRPVVENLVAEQMGYYLAEHAAFADDYLLRIQKSAYVREQARKARDAARKGKKNNKTEKLLSGKLANAQSRNPAKNELFLVEGDSAGGSAKQGRDSKFQAILPLRGKVLNTEKANLSDIEKNEELNTLIHAIGAGVGADFELSECNYDKIIIMTDADTDGAHIQVLLLTFFYRYMRPLVDAGRVFIALPPLFKAKTGKQLLYAYDENELDSLRRKYGKLEIQRYKGLGEMNAQQLWETTMDPANRTLIRVGVEDALNADRKVSVLMGDRVDVRRQWIESHVDFTSEAEEF